MNRVLTPVIAPLWVILSVTSGMTSDYVSISGYYKNFFSVYDPPRIGIDGNSVDSPEIGDALNRLRLNLSRKFGTRIDMNISYSLAPRVNFNSFSYADLRITELNQSDYRIDDIDYILYPENPRPGNTFIINQNLDRLYCGIRGDNFDLYIGRQAIAWGSARVVNPTDILAPYRFEELDTEERIGVDAIRARIPMGALSELDLGVVSGKDFNFKSSAAFLRGKFYTLKADVSAMIIAFRENLMTGLDIATSVGGAGVWLESAYTFPDALNDDSNIEKDDSYLTVSLGSDYSFGDKTYGFIEYYFNQAGAGDPNEYRSQFTKTAYTEGSVYLLGKHYLISGINYQITPLMNYSGQLLTNLNDPSVFFYSLLEYNFASNIYLSGGAFIGVGKKPEVNYGFPVSEDLNSEFGTYPDIYFTSISIYF